MIKILGFVLYTLFIFVVWSMLKAASDADDEFERLMNEEKGDE